MDHHQHCDLLAREVERFATLIDGAPLEAPVPSCPGWSIADLTNHLGSVHRWAEHLVRVRAPKPISAEDMGLGQPETSADWLRSGGQILVATLRTAEPDAEMWAWGADQHVRFWSRRQLHETMVHRIDAQLALGQPPDAAPPVAADAIDEFLANLGAAAYFSPRVRNLRGNNQRLMFSATDEHHAWGVTLHPEGFELVRNPSSNEAALSGPALTLLLVLYGRLPPTDPAVTISGDASMVDFWLANSALE